MPDVDIFLDVYSDLRFPFIAVDVDELRKAIADRERGETVSVFNIPLAGEAAKRAALVSAWRGLLRKIDLPPAMIRLIADFEAIERAGILDALHCLAEERAAFGVWEGGNRLVWTEESPWPRAYSTFLTQLVNVATLHRTAIEQKIGATAQTLNDHGYAAENVPTISEYPRQCPTHLHYAMASLGAWVGGSINVQYFAYYAVIRQIYHADLNIKYAKRIGFSDADAEALNDGGIIAVPAPLFLPLLEAQGDVTVFGSLPIDEFNITNRPCRSFFQSAVPDSEQGLHGFVVDKFYRAPFRARRLDGHGFYGAKNVLRDQYEEFYAGVAIHRLVRCKHYCAPIVEVSSVEELRSRISSIPVLDKEGVFLRGQQRLYLIDRNERVRKMLFADSCDLEPSLITAASREQGYDYDFAHFGLKAFLEGEVLGRSDAGQPHLWEEWRKLSMDARCRLDTAILALAQHYGLPSHGLDVTTSEDVALWFATNRYSRDLGGTASYKPLSPQDWPSDREQWPVVLASQNVTHSIQQSLHDCELLTPFGFEARRPAAQQARFFQGGHSDHQNRLAEALVCVFRLAPGEYRVQSTFESLFPPPSADPAYAAMLRFAASPMFGPTLGRYVNRFHPQDNLQAARA